MASVPAKARLTPPEVLLNLRDLELRARVVVEGFWSGLHRSPFHGFSAEFTEYRQYAPGDDLRHLDWRVYARSDRFFLKRFEDETNLRCHLVVDQSRSMAYGSVGWSKGAYAATLAATLARLLHQQGDAVGLLTFDQRVRDYLPPRNRSGYLRRLTLLLDRESEGRGTDVVPALERTAELARKRGLVVCISDFLAPLERLRPALLQLAACGHELILFQVLDPTEITLQLPRVARYEDLETGRVLTVDPAAARRDYRRRFEDHCRGLEETCRPLGASLVRLRTDQPLELALYDFLRARMRSTKRSPRRRGPAGSLVA